MLYDEADEPHKTVWRPKINLNIIPSRFIEAFLTTRSGDFEIPSKNELQSLYIIYSLTAENISVSDEEPAFLTSLHQSG